MPVDVGVRADPRLNWCVCNRLEEVQCGSASIGGEVQRGAGGVPVAVKVVDFGGDQVPRDRSPR
eukprot:12935553-Prorocentrum_lima.AAC.1